MIRQLEQALAQSASLPLRLTAMGESPAAAPNDTGLDDPQADEEEESYNDTNQE